MKKMISLLVALGVLVMGVGMPQAGSDRALCKQAIMLFIEAHGMQSDDNYNVVQPTEEQEREMRGLIRREVASANKVADTFLDVINHQLRFEFRDHLVVAGRFAPGYNAVDHSLVALCEAPHNKRMQQTIPPANKFASGLAPDPH